MTTETKSKTAAQKPQADRAKKSSLTISRREAELIYPIYAALAREFSLGKPPCHESDVAAALTVPASAQKILRWILELDQRVQVHQLRYLLQTTSLPTEERLRVLIQWHLRKPKRAETDREKVDFLCTQYFVLCATQEVLASSVSLAAVAGVLRQVFGTAAERVPGWLAPLEAILSEAMECDCLRNLLEGGYLEQGRELKSSAEEHFYEPAALAAFTRFNFLMRRRFIQLMHADLQAIREGLARIKEHGASTVDCRRAGLSAKEPLASLQDRCERWKQPFRTDYTEASAGHNFGLLLAIRADVEEALARIEKPEASDDSSALMDIVIEEFTSPPEEPEVSPKTSAPSPKTSQPAAATSAPRAPLPPTASAPAAVPEVTIDAEECMEQIWEQLIAAPLERGRSMTTVVCQGSRVLLSSWEVAAFLSESGSASEGLRTAVVARALVTVASEYFKRTKKEAPLRAALALARKEATRAQEQVDSAKRAKDADAAVNLGITAKRLRTAIEEAEKR